MESVRLANSTDAMAIHGIDRECFPDNCAFTAAPPNGPRDTFKVPLMKPKLYTGEWENKIKSAETRVHVGTVIDRVVGFSYTSFHPLVDPKELHIEKIGVSEVWRSQGVSKKLLGTIYELGMALNCNKLALWVPSKKLRPGPDNLSGWVKRLGFSLTLEEKVLYSEYGEDVIGERFDLEIRTT